MRRDLRTRRERYRAYHHDHAADSTAVPNVEDLAIKCLSDYSTLIVKHWYFPCLSLSLTHLLTHLPSLSFSRITHIHKLQLQSTRIPPLFSLSYPLAYICFQS